MGVGGQRKAPAVLPPGEGRGIHWTECYVSLRAVLDGYGKSHPPPQGFEPQTVQLVPIPYTEKNKGGKKLKSDVCVNLSKRKRQTQYLQKRHQ
jgi:hypothetical protein